MSPAAPAGGADDALPDVSFVRQPNVELLAWRQILPELAEQDSTPMLRIYGDGLVVVHRPFYMKNSGRYATRIGEQELNALLGALAIAMVPFDARDVSELKRQTDDQAWDATEDWRDLTLVHHADADTSVFRLNLDAWRPPGESTWKALEPLERKWTALRFDARDYPDIEALQALDQAEKRLRALAQSDDLIRVGDTTP